MFGFSLVGLDIKEAGVDAIKEPEGGPVVARSKCYALLAEALKAPGEDWFERVQTGAYEQQLREAASELPYELAVSLGALPDGWDAEEYESQFLRIFDVGAGSPPCPLYGGIWLGNRMGVMEEVVRFYNYFGLKASEERPIPPDHLATELEFLHYLTFREAAAPMPTLAAPYGRAQLDFLERHPGRFVPQIAERLRSIDAPKPFAALGELLEAFITAERTHLASAGTGTATVATASFGR